MPKKLKQKKSVKQALLQKIDQLVAAFKLRQQESAHRSFRMSRKSELPNYKKIPSWWRLLKQTVQLLWSQRLVIGGLLAIYIILFWIINGFYATSGFSEFKSLLGDSQEWFNPLGIFTLLGGFFLFQTENTAEGATILMNVLAVFFWLAFIWAARYALAKKTTTLRETVYSSGTALVPFLMLVTLVVIQSIPAALGVSIAMNVTGEEFSTGTLEIFTFSLLAVLLMITSIYFVSSTLIALQIVALPGMFPYQALRSARQLITGQQFNVLRKYVMIVVVISFGWLLFLAPTLLLEHAICGQNDCWAGFTIVPFVYYLLLGLSVAIASTYMYVIYRALLQAKEG